MVSASKSALVLSPCIRWAWTGAKPYEDRFADTTKRDKGTEFHRLMDLYYRKGEPYAIHEPCAWSDVHSWVCLAIGWSQAHLEPRCSEIHPELFTSFNFETGEHFVDANVQDRKYPDMPGFLPGTADLVCVLADGSLLVADWKTGGGAGADKQLATLALGLRNHFRKADGSHRLVRLAILYATDDGVRPVEWEVTDAELAAHQQAMAFQLADVGVRKDAVPGVHCTQLYCPHLAYCPGVTAIVDGASESPEGLLPATSLARKFTMGAPTSDEHAGYVMSRITAAKRQLAYLEECVRKHAIDGGRVLADGFEYSKRNDGFRWRPRK